MVSKWGKSHSISISIVCIWRGCGGTFAPPALLACFPQVDDLLVVLAKVMHGPRPALLGIQPRRIGVRHGLPERRVVALVAHHGRELGGCERKARVAAADLAIAPQAQQAHHGGRAAAVNKPLGLPVRGEAGVEFH